MTCAGVSSLIITGLRRFQGQEFLQGETIQNCGKGGINSSLQAGINWLAEHFQVSQNFGNGLCRLMVPDYTGDRGAVKGRRDARTTVPRDSSRPRGSHYFGSRLTNPFFSLNV